ncbi:NADH dehydrogenase 1, alpha/beta subcomplex subunit 1 ndufab1/ACP [Sparganum proliferum]
MNRSALRLASFCKVLSTARQAQSTFNSTHLLTHRFFRHMNARSFPVVPVNPCRRFSHGPPLTKPMIEDRVLLVLRLYDKVDGEKLNLKSKLKKDFGLDSLDMVEVVMAMEEEFMFEIPDSDAQRFNTPLDIVQYICDKHDIYD